MRTHTPSVSHVWGPFLGRQGVTTLRWIPRYGGVVAVTCSHVWVSWPGRCGPGGAGGAVVQPNWKPPQMASLSIPDRMRQRVIRRSAGAMLRNAGEVMMATRGTGSGAGSGSPPASRRAPLAGGREWAPRAAAEKVATQTGELRARALPKGGPNRYRLRPYIRMRARRSSRCTIPASSANSNPASHIPVRERRPCLHRLHR